MSIVSHHSYLAAEAGHAAPEGAGTGSGGGSGSAGADDPAEAVSALRSSWAAVEQLGDHAASYFYATLFTIDPQLREMFPAAMGGQRDRLLAALGHIVSHVDDGDTLTRFVQQLGRDHRRFEVRPEHYPVVGQALLHTLATHLGDTWTPALAAAWTEAYGRVSNAMIAAAAESAQREPARWDAQIESHDRRSADIAVITARITGGLTWHAGQSIAVESHLRPRVWRYFSPANIPRGDGLVEFHVRAVPGGQLSPALVYQAQVGDVLHLSAPIGTWLTVPPGPGPDLLLLAGGTGLSPLRAIVEQLTSSGDPRRVTMIAGANWQHELYDLEALRGFGQRHPQLSVYVALAADPSLGPPRTVAQAAVDGGDWRDRLVYICGSPGMTRATRQALVDAGYTPDQLRTEPYDGTTYAPLQEGQAHARVSSNDRA